MTRDFTKIAEDSMSEKQRLLAKKYRQPVSYARDLFEDLDNYLIGHLQSMEEEAQNLDGANLSEDDKYESQKSYFKQLHRIRRYREQIHSENIPIEIYYFVDSVIRELDPEDDFYIISSNTRVKNNRFDTLLHTTAENLEKYNKEVLDMNPILIQLPRNEMDNPFTYCLIPHEIFHNMSVTEELKNDFDYTTSSISDSEKEELVVDALSLNYMGPSYAISLIDLYDRIKEEDVESYPPIETRRGYLIHYLKYLKLDSDLPQVYNDVIHIVKQEIAEKRGDETPDYIIPDEDSESKFRQFNDDVVSKMNENDIPVFVQRCNQIREEFQVNSIESGKLRRKIDILMNQSETLSNSKETKPVSIAIHPVILFNILLLIEDWRENDLVTPALSSFRKWYAKTNYRIS